jgi:hypothetical protein
MRWFATGVMVVLSVAPLLQAQSLTGTWTGTHVTEYTYCSAKPKTSGTATLVLAQQNAAVNGTFLWEAEGTEGCRLTGRETVPFRLEGRTDGTTLTAKIFYVDDPSDPKGFEVGPLVATVTGNAMTFEVIAPSAPEDVPSDGPIQLIVRGQATRAATIPLPNANVVVSAFPAGMVQNVGEATATDSFALTNTGTASADIVLAASEDFFTLPVTSLTLAPGQTQRIGLEAVAQSTAGARIGAITVHGGGVSSIRVTLLSGTSNAANRLTGPPSRSETVAPAERLLVDGAASFTNSGATTLIAVAVSDVPWILPQPGAITIQAGQTVMVPFQVDRAKRPDAAALLGGAAGRLSLRFVTTGPATSAQSVTPQATTPINSVSVQIVDVVQPGTANQPFPPLQPGEVAYFISGLGGRNGKLTDLLLSNRATTKATDLRMFFNSFGPGSVTKLVSLPQGFDPNVAVTFPSMAKNVFDAIGQVGTLQLRGTSAGSMSVAAVQLASDVTGRYATALPVLRSDRAAGAGERISLAGIEATSVTHTTLFIQEVSGGHGTVQVQFVNASGAMLLPARMPDSVDGFRLFELAVPPGATLARINIVNDGGGARFAAYALVSDDETGDGWVVSDITRGAMPASSLFIVPLVSVDGQSPARNLYLTNNDSTASVDVVFDQLSAMTRRRSVVHGMTVEPDSTLTIPPLQTVTPLIAAGNGHLRMTAPPGTFSASARATAGTTAGGVFGTGLFAVSSGAALSNGGSKRITGIDDSAANRATLILVETAGQSATVRLTLRFVFSSGTKVSAYAASSRTMTLGPRQMLTMSELAKSIIGLQRDAFGDLINSQLDVEVIDGTGAVVALVQSIDNGSGDVVMRD